MLELCLVHSRYSINACPEEEEGLGATLGDLSPELVRDVPGSKAKEPSKQTLGTQVSFLP